MTSSPPESSIAALFARHVEVATCCPREHGDGYTATELAVVEKAGPKRRQEFLAGRVAARKALAALGVHDFDLLPAPDRAPVWPERVVGSITHTRDLCVVVVARSDDLDSVGIDAEPDDGIEENLWERICTAGELAWLESQPEVERGRLARRVFSAKEAVYKCQYPLTQTFLEFGEVEIEFAGDTPHFAARLPAKLASPLAGRTTMAGRWVIIDGTFVTTVELEK